VKKSGLFLFALWALLCLSLRADADIIYADASYTGSVELGTEAQPFKTIQGAIDRAIPTIDDVSVKPGTYDESITLKSNVDVIGEDRDAVIINGVNETPAVLGNGISGVLLKSFTISDTSGGGIELNDSTMTVEDCLISGNSASSGGGIYIVNSDLTVENTTVYDNQVICDGGGIAALDSSTLTLDDVLVWGNVALHLADAMGGGIFIDTGSTANMDRCRVLGNAAAYGAGIYWKSSGGYLRRSLIFDNTASLDGGGLFVHDSDPKITRTEISANRSTDRYGGGIYLYQSPDAALHNCIIDRNYSWDRGGAIICHESSATVVNNTIVSNIGYPYVPGAPANPDYLEDGGIITDVSSAPLVLNCILWDNGDDIDSPGAVVVYCQIQDGDPGQGNDADDPLLTDADDRDYTLQGGSPCIDTGHPDASFNDPDGTRNDRGAYGGPYAPIPSDVTDDGCVDILDLIHVRNNLNKDPESEGDENCDINNDGDINILDLLTVRNSLNDGCSTPRWP